MLSLRSLIYLWYTLVLTMLPFTQIVQNSKVTLPMLNPIFACSMLYPNSAIRTNGNHQCSSNTAVYHILVIGEFFQQSTFPST